jgi:ABC-type amino acid transport substrate-binding protein
MMPVYSHGKAGSSNRGVPRGTLLGVGILRKVMTLMSWLLYCLIVGSCSSKPAPRELVVGMDLSYPPFETIDEDGRPAGISVELATALAKRLNSLDHPV